MSSLLKTIFKSKKFYLIITIILILNIFISKPYIQSIYEVFISKNIDVRQEYLIGCLIYPIDFENINIILFSIFTICYLCIIFYPILQIISFFLNDFPMATVNIGRDKVIKNIYVFSLIYSFIMTVIYVLVLLLYYYFVTGVFMFPLFFIKLFILKYLFCLISINIFITIYLIFDEYFYSYLFAIGSNIFINYLCTTFTITIINEKIIFNNTVMFILFSILLIILIYIFMKKIITTKDLGGAE